MGMSVMAMCRALLQHDRCIKRKFTRSGEDECEVHYRLRIKNEVRVNVVKTCATYPWEAVN